MTETKDIAVLTREEAVQKAVNYCKNSKAPNVAPDTSNMCFGLAGLVFIDSGAASLTEVVYFPIQSNMPGMTSLPMSDRLDISGFFDTYGKESFIDINKAQSVCYMVNIAKGVCAAIPFGMLDVFKSTQVLVESLKKNNDVFFGGVIKEISDKVFGVEQPAPSKTEVPKKERTKFSAKVTEVLLYDRVDFLAEYDKLFDTKLICVDAPDNVGDSLVICLGQATYIRVSAFMTRASLSVAVLLDSLDNNWFVDKDFLT